MESILDTIKDMLGSSTEYDDFDKELIVYINTALNVLYQLGVGPKGFHITSNAETWNDFLPDIDRFHMVKDFIYLKVKQAFDPNQNSNITAEYNKQIDELAWRINVEIESGEE